MISRFRINKNAIHIISLSCNVVPPPRYGGIELVIANLCYGLTQLGAKVVCYSPGAMTLDGVQHERTLAEPSRPISDGGVANTREHLENVLCGLQERAKPGDVVLFNHAEQFRFLKKPIGFLKLLRLNLFEVAHWMDAGVYKNVIYPTSDLKSVIGKPGVVIPHGVKLQFTDGSAQVEDYLFFAGRITKDKGVDIALSACEQIGCKLMLAGPLHDQAFADDVFRSSNVEYLGELSYHELFHYYERARALIYMTQYVEPFGLSVIESMAAGRPVITTGKGGTGETVLHGKTGFFCDTVSDIKEAYPKLAVLSAQHCVERAREYSVERMCQSYISVFNQQSPSSVF